MDVESTRNQQRHEPHDQPAGCIRESQRTGGFYKRCQSPRNALRQNPPFSYAHARIKSIDASQAEALVGVRDILRYDDPDIEFDNETLPGFEASRNYNLLTLPRTSEFFQHPMGVVVVADTEEICDRALRLLKIEWEERPFILDMAESLKPDAPKIMPEVKFMNPKAKEPNTVLTDRAGFGDVEKGFAEADKVIEYTITRARNTPAGVEPIVCVAQWRGDFLDLWVHHQDLPNATVTTSNTVREKRRAPLAEWAKISVTMPYQVRGTAAFMAFLLYAFIRLTAILPKERRGNQ
jgi:hypothetical protein